MTAPEIGYLWAGYMVDHMSVCFLTAFHEMAADPDTLQLLQFALEFGKEQLEKRRDIFHTENMPLPKGFQTEEDVHPSAPALFSDRVLNHYLLIASRLGLIFHSNAHGLAVREDVQAFTAGSIAGTSKLYSMVMGVMLKKGQYLRPPVITLPDTPEFIQKSSFLDGLLGERRPLTAMEIAGLYNSMELVHLLDALNTGFAQAARDPRVKGLHLKAKSMAEEHLSGMGKLLGRDDLHEPVPYLSEVSNSTEASFSERLMLCHAAGLNGSLLEAYGYALGYSMRTDLAALYMKQAGQAGLLAEEMSKTLIDLEWLEKPPGALERRVLS